MPFKSKKQAKMFFARAKDDPKWKKMAKHWASATDFSKLKESEIDEMPHIDVNKDVEGMHFGTVDLRFEKYPGFSKGDREQFMNSFEREGVAARAKNGKWLFFSPDGDVSIATPDQMISLQKLPSDWHEYMLNIDVTETPRMSEVFKR